MKWLVPKTCLEHFSKIGGYTWELFDITRSRNHAVEVFHNVGERICIRQDQKTSVDIVTLTHGQAYDLMKVLARALETPK